MRFPRPIVFSLVLLALSSPLLAQCPIGTVKIRGRVDNLPADAASSEVLVTLETPKGGRSKTASVSNGEFSAQIQFGTQSAPYFPLWGHRCNNVPKSVEIKAMIGNRIAGQVRLTFKDDFEPESPNVYRLKRELAIKA
jgi:hypothetical protein